MATKRDREISDKLVEELRVAAARQRVKPIDIVRASGMASSTVYSIWKGESLLDVDQLARISRVLHLNPGDLVNRVTGIVDESGVMPRTGDSVRPGIGADVRTVILWLLAHPEDDEELNVRLTDIDHQVDLGRRRMDRLRSTIRNARREELEQALSALPPHNPSSANRTDRQSG